MITASSRFSLFLLLMLSACTDPAAEFPFAPQFQSLASSEWSVPVHLDAPVNSPFRELAARLSPDELSLYLSSNRPGGEGAVDIWVSRRACQECPWQEPINLGPNINSLGGDGGSSLSPDGHLLFFSSARAGGQGGEDIWVSHRTDTNDDLSWEPAVNLGPTVNTPADERSPEYIPALHGGGVSLYFERAGGGIYEVLVTRDGEVVGPDLLVAGLGDPSEHGVGFTLRADGREVIVTLSGQHPGGMGQTDLWVATRPSPRGEWSPLQNVGEPVNTPFGDLTPTLSRDGRTLFISVASAARPSLGLQDIWMTTRAPGAP